MPDIHGAYVDAKKSVGLEINRTAPPHLSPPPKAELCSQYIKTPSWTTSLVTWTVRERYRVNLGHENVD